jgi:hypothetical protein
MLFSEMRVTQPTSHLNDEAGSALFKKWQAATK